MKWIKDWGPGAFPGLLLYRRQAAILASQREALFQQNAFILPVRLGFVWMSVLQWLHKGKIKYPGKRMKTIELFCVELHNVYMNIYSYIKE